MHSVFSLLTVPLAAAILMPFASRVHRRVADGLVVLAALAMLVLSLNFVPLSDGVLTFSRFSIHLSLDGLSTLFALVINSIGFFCLVYSIDYVEHLGGRAKFYSLFMILLLGLNGVVLVRDLFSLYVYLEVASIASYVLVAFTLEYDGIESALKYLLLSAVGTGLVLVGLSLIYMATGTLEFAALREALKNPELHRLFLLAAAMFITGFGLKAAIMPFHAWLPDAHPSAPAPVSAILSGVVIKVAGVYSLVRVFLYLYPRVPQVLHVFLILGILSMVGGALLAYCQDDIKRMLAYSSISQIGIIMIGLGTGHPLGIAGALFHVMNHSQFKALLFLNSGALQYRLHTRNMSEMGGLENRMKVTSVTSVFGTLSIAGIPPFNGFWSKFFVIMGAVYAHMYGVATIVAVFSLFTLGYFLVIQRKVFFGKLNPKWQEIKEVPAFMSTAMICLAALCLFTGVFFGRVMNRVVDPAAKVLTGGN